MYFWKTLLAAQAAQLRVLHCLVIVELERMWKETTVLHSDVAY